MDRHGGRGVLVAHPVDVRRVEVERRPRAVVEPAWLPAQDEALLDDLPLDDRDGAGRDVVVVEPRVVAVRPRDHPDVEVVVAPQLLEVALGAVEACQRAPLLRLGRDPRDELGQLRAIEISPRADADHAASSVTAAPRSREGLRSRSATSTAAPSDSSAPAMTGRSLPWTSR